MTNSQLKTVKVATLHMSTASSRPLLARRIKNALAARPSWGLAVLRLVVGTVFLESGSRKLFQIGVGALAASFASMHLPLPLVSALIVTLLEVLGGIFLLLGLFTRLAAALLAIDMLVAVLVVYFEPAFFKGGTEFPLTLFATCIALALSGASAASLDGTSALVNAMHKLNQRISSYQVVASTPSNGAS